MSLIEEALRRAEDPTLSSSIKAAAKHEGTDPLFLEEPPSSEGSPVPGRIDGRSTAVNLWLMAAAGAMVATVVLVGVTWFGGQARLDPSSLEPTGSSTVVASAQSRGAVKKKLFPTLIKMRGAQEAFVISGVAQGAGPSFAVINGEILAVGETINGATLLEIQESTVRLRTKRGDELAIAVHR